MVGAALQLVLSEPPWGQSLRCSSEARFAGLPIGERADDLVGHRSGEETQLGEKMGSLDYLKEEKIPSHSGSPRSDPEKLTGDWSVETLDPSKNSFKV